MAVYFYTKSSSGLLVAIRDAIDKGHIRTWSYDKDGDFTHAVDQWRFKAWLRPKSLPDRLALYILAPKGTNISKEVYGIYHGRFIESVLVHADRLFDRAESTAMAVPGDLVAAP